MPPRAARPNLRPWKVVFQLIERCPRQCGSAFVLALLCIVWLMRPSNRNLITRSDLGSWWLDQRSPTEKLEEALGDGLKVLVVSHGGAGTWSFVNYLNSRGIQKTWLGTVHGMVHYPRPIWLRPAKASQLTAVYIYDDPLIAICSMKARSFHHNVFSYLRERKVHFSYDIDLSLLEAMFAQFGEWTRPGAARDVGYPIVFLSYKDTLDDECLRAVCMRLGTCRNYRRSWLPGQSAADALLPQGGDSGGGRLRGGLLLPDADPAKPAEQHHRKTNLSSPCVVDLERRLSQEQRDMVQEMRSFQGCIVTLPSGGTIPRPPNLMP